MEEKNSEVQPIEVSIKPKKCRPKIVLVSVFALVLAAGLVFAGYKFGQRYVQFQDSLTPTPTIISSRPSFPVDLGPESFIFERIGEALFIARIKVVDIFSSQPISEAKVTLQAHLACPAVEGVKCEQPEFTGTTNEFGIVTFNGERLKELLERTSFSILVESTSYEKYSHEIPFGLTPIDIVVKLLGSSTARITNSNQAFSVAESHLEVPRWLKTHQESPGFGKSAKFEKPFWLVEYADKFTCPRGYDPSDPKCVLRIRVNAQTGEVLVLSEEEEKEEYCVKAETGEKMSLSEAKEIVLASECVREGSLKETHFCNENSGTWWIDLDIQKQGCNPACVINVATKKAEINPRCTGLIPQ